MTDRPQSVKLEAFEHVLPVPGIALLRVLGTRSRRRSSASRPNLVIRDEQSTRRFAPLPAPDDPSGALRVAYSVPSELLEHEGVTFALEFQTGGPLTLPPPTVGSMRLPAPGRERDPEQSRTADAVPDADLDEDRRIAIHEKLVQQSEALADLTSELAATKQALEDAQRERRRLDGELAEMQSERDTARAQARATLASLLGELEDARLRAAHSDDLAREVEVSRGEADRLQAAVVSLESEIRSTGQGQLDPPKNGSDREPTAVSSALDSARDEMNALRRELEIALASERKANLELVMLTAETQARLQAQTELKQAARESGMTQ